MFQGKRNTEEIVFYTTVTSTSWTGVRVRKPSTQGAEPWKWNSMRGGRRAREIQRASKGSPSRLRITRAPKCSAVQTETGKREEGRQRGTFTVWNWLTWFIMGPRKHHKRSTSQDRVQVWRQRTRRTGDVSPCSRRQAGSRRSGSSRIRRCAATLRTVVYLSESSESVTGLDMTGNNVSSGHSTAFLTDT